MTKDRSPYLGDSPMQVSLTELSLRGAPGLLDTTGRAPPQEWNVASLPWRQEVPVSMPWSCSSAGFVTFTGSVMSSSTERSDLPGVMTVKRRNEKDGEGPSRKHFLSEEAMSARFTCLSLTNDHVYGSNGFPIAKGQHRADTELHFQDLERRLAVGEEEWSAESVERKDVIVEGMFDMSDSRVIVMSSALQNRLKIPTEDILPREVLRSMSHPCMELMLWEPPGSMIQRAIRALRLGGEGKERGSEHEPERTCGPRQWSSLLHQLEDEMEL
uniref:uncharacterized protein n=1 Tax=Pristiophorus japonicus TaxID=55135 RepID=UPI00398E9699